MSTNQFVNDIIREAFTSGDRSNTTPNSNGLNDKGGTARQMLSGEWFGSVAWPFDQATAKEFAGSTELQAAQANQGQGEGVGGAAMESAGKELVDGLLEDSPSYLYTDPTTVGYFVNSLRESNFDEGASLIEEAIANPTIENLESLMALAEELDKQGADDYFVEGVMSLVEYMMNEEDSIEDGVDDGSQKDKDEKEPKAEEDEPK